MGLTLDLPVDLANALRSAAEERGLSLPEYAVEVLARSRMQADEVRTGADLVRYWEDEGLLGNRPDITDSSEHARRIREQAQKRM